MGIPSLARSTKARRQNSEPRICTQDNSAPRVWGVEKFLHGRMSRPKFFEPKNLIKS